MQFTNHRETQITKKHFKIITYCILSWQLINYAYNCQTSVIMQQSLIHQTLTEFYFWVNLHMGSFILPQSGVFTSERLKSMKWLQMEKKVEETQTNFWAAKQTLVMKFTHVTRHVDIFHVIAQITVNRAE